MGAAGYGQGGFSLTYRVEWKECRVGAGDPEGTHSEENAIPSQSQVPEIQGKGWFKTL